MAGQCQEFYRPQSLWSKEKGIPKAGSPGMPFSYFLVVMKKIPLEEFRGNEVLQHADAIPPDVLDAKLEDLKDQLTAQVVDRVRAANEQLLQQHAALKPLMSVADVATSLKVGSRTVEKLIAQGKIRPLWIKGQRRFHPDAISKYLRLCEKPPRSRKRRRI